MKPIEKYKEKFVELLREVEEELGGSLTVKVASKEVEDRDLSGASYIPVGKKNTHKEYQFSISTTDGFIF